MSEVFFPLRSNAAWFTDSASVLALEARIKNCLVFYDKLVFEDGRYECFALDTGVFDQWTGPDAIEKRDQLSYFAAGEKIQVFVGHTPDEMVPLKMASGTLRARYEVDFFPILNAPGLVAADGLSWRRIGRPLDDNLFAAIGKDIETDQQDVRLREALPVVHFLQNKIIEALHYDAAKAAFATRSPFVIDERTRDVVAAKVGRIRERLEPDVRGVMSDEWVSMRLPDFSSLTWDQVMRIRESAPGRDLRNLFDRLGEQITRQHSNMTHEEMALEAKRFITGELVDELASGAIGLKDVVLNLIANIISFGAIASTGADVQKYLAARQSWVALLMPGNRFGTR